MTPAAPAAIDAPGEPEVGSSFYYSSLFLPAERRTALCDLDAFCREAEQLGRGTADGRAALSRWRESIDGIFGDGAPPPEGTLAARLAAHAGRLPLPRQAFLDVLDGAAMDLERSRYGGWEELKERCRLLAAGTVLGVAVFEPRRAASRAYAAELGQALQLTRMLRDVGQDAAEGRIYLPAEDRERFGVSEEEILSRTPTPEFGELMAFESARARRVFFQADLLLPPEDRMALFVAEILGRIHYQTLERIEGSGFDVLRRRIDLPRHRKAIIAFSTWLKYKILGGS